jgi:hypothetical protein
MIRSRIVTIGILFAAASGQGCMAAPVNPLLGKWRVEPNGFVDGAGYQYCKTTLEMDFTPTTQTMRTASGPTVTKVTYIVGPTVVFVSSVASAGDPIKFVLIGANELKAPGVGACKFRRE